MVPALGGPGWLRIPGGPDAPSNVQVQQGSYDTFPEPDYPGTGHPVQTLEVNMAPPCRKHFLSKWSFGRLLNKFGGSPGQWKTNRIQRFYV